MTTQQLLARVAVVFAVEPHQLLAGNRAPHLVEARQAAAYMLRFGRDQSYAAIAEALGYRDHTTAIWAVQAAADRAKVRPDYSERIKQIGAMS
jgi:chromosomal replication initiation ATPase DnaA